MFFYKKTINLTAATSANGASFYSTILGGAVYSLRFVESATTPLSTKRLISVCRDSSLDVIMKTVMPGSNCNRYPRVPIHGTTGQELKSTDFRDLFPMCNERLKLCVTSASSKNSVSASVVAYMVGGGG